MIKPAPLTASGIAEIEKRRQREKIKFEEIRHKILRTPSLIHREDMKTDLERYGGDRNAELDKLLETLDHWRERAIHAENTLEQIQDKASDSLQGFDRDRKWAGVMHRIIKIADDTLVHNKGENY